MSSDISSHIESIETMGSILRDMILASASTRELGSNETAVEVAVGLQSTQQQIASGLETYIEKHPESVEKIFRLNEEVIHILLSLTLSLTLFYLFH